MSNRERSAFERASLTLQCRGTSRITSNHGMLMSCRCKKLKMQALNNSRSKPLCLSFTLSLRLRLTTSEKSSSSSIRALSWVRSVIDGSFSAFFSSTLVSFDRERLQHACLHWALFLHVCLHGVDDMANYAKNQNWKRKRGIQHSIWRIETCIASAHYGKHSNSI